MASKKKQGRHKPRSKRPGTFTPAVKQAFLEHRAAGMTVTEAAKKAGVDAVTVFRHARNDAEFKKAFDEAAQLCCDDLEAFMETLGRSGNIAALFGTLKAMRPERWGSHVKIEHSGHIGMTTADELAAARERAINRSLNGATQH